MRGGDTRYLAKHVSNRHTKRRVFRDSPFAFGGGGRLGGKTFAERFADGLLRFTDKSL